MVVGFKSIYVSSSDMHDFKLCKYVTNVSLAAQFLLLENLQVKKLLPTGRALCLMVQARKFGVRYKIYPRCCVHQAERLFMLIP